MARSAPPLEPKTLLLIRAVLARHPEVTGAWLFGSRAGGTNRPGSDIDIAVLGPSTALDVERIRGELDDLPLPYSFDLLSLDLLQNRRLREEIVRGGLPIT